MEKGEFFGHGKESVHNLLLGGVVKISEKYPVQIWRSSLLLFVQNKELPPENGYKLGDSPFTKLEIKVCRYTEFSLTPMGMAMSVLHAFHRYYVDWWIHQPLYSIC